MKAPRPMGKKQIKAMIACEHGVSSLELALMLPFLMTMILGIVEYGWYFKTKIEMDNALSAASRAVITEDGEDSARDIAVAAMMEALDAKVTSYELESCLSVTTLTDPDRARVALSDFPHESLTGFFPSGILPSGISSTAVMTYP